MIVIFCFTHSSLYKSAICSWVEKRWGVWGWGQYTNNQLHLQYTAAFFEVSMSAFKRYGTNETSGLKRYCQYFI